MKRIHFVCRAPSSSLTQSPSPGSFGHPPSDRCSASRCPVVGRIGEDEVDLTALAVQGGHGLQILTFDKEVPRAVVLAPDGVLLDRSHDARTHTTGELARVGLALEVGGDAALVALLEEFDELVAREFVETARGVQLVDDGIGHGQEG